ncbi:TMAO reductase system periplasmic protein TorT [Limibacillus halophilus]|uniref:Protein TorT n=1 Tax=Limibacillus halophilus TaxID=1579333 RepID=A0A839SS19_9PROT|nr:TMAO reductase system periplasmic protein TorT [Limibacillus halophilus]MBB3064510.1 protein TorT [Limibacillus halophilus]
MFQRALAVTALLSIGLPAYAGDDWSMQIRARNPAFDPGAEWINKEYKPLPASEVTKKWDICVLFPHTKDPYYIAMTYGSVTEAEDKGLSMSVYAAGGYTELPTQISQMEDCITRGADAIMIVAISATGLNRTISVGAKKGVPLAITGGEVDSDDVAARALGNWFDSGRIAGEYLNKLHPVGSEPVKVLWMAGPEGPNWSVDSAEGFVKTVEGNNAIEVVKVIWGEPGKASQIPLIEDALLTYPDIKYIGGIAPAIEGGVQVLKEKGRQDIQLIASYMTPETEAALREGTVLGVVTDYTAAQARIAIDQLVRILEGKEVDADVDTGFAMIDASNVDTYDRSLSLAPVGWDPYFRVD